MADKGYQSVWISGVLLMLFAAFGAGLVGVTHRLTDARIAENQRQAVRETLHQVLSPSAYDNRPLEATVRIPPTPKLGLKEASKAYVARQGGAPVAVVLRPVANGYNGSIRLMVAVRFDGRIAGVRVLSHRETPGLGDGIERRRSDWITTFDGQSLGRPPPSDWKVKKDGGVFDQFTGATITPRAVVATVRATLEYVATHRAALFEAAANVPQTEGFP